MKPAGLVPCGGCGALFPASVGPTHPYMLGSAGCWAAYGAVLTREYEDRALFAAVHRFTVDAYAVQHPGDPADRRARQSVWIHFASLDAIFRHGRSHDQARALLSYLAGAEFPPLPTSPTWQLTAADMASAEAGRHAQSIEAWARHAHAGWLAAIGQARADELAAGAPA